MNPVIRAKLDLIIAVTAFGTIGIFVRYIALPSSIIALVRGAVGAAFLWLLLRWKKTPFQREALRPHLKLQIQGTQIDGPPHPPGALQHRGQQSLGIG